MGTPDALEAVLLAAALLGVVHHWRNLSGLAARCDGVMIWSDVLLCRMYRRRERVHMGVKAALAVVALWLLSQPSPLLDHSYELIGFLFFRVALISIAVALDWESIRAHADRAALIRGGRKSP